MWLVWQGSPEQSPVSRLTSPQYDLVQQSARSLAQKNIFRLHPYWRASLSYKRILVMLMSPRWKCKHGYVVIQYFFITSCLDCRFGHVVHSKSDLLCGILAWHTLIRIAIESPYAQCVRCYRFTPSFLLIDHKYLSALAITISRSLTLASLGCLFGLGSCVFSPYQSSPPMSNS
jgi:hypothetical protein